MTRPNVIILAGPNRAGKTTAAPRVLAETLDVAEFVNADTIARGLSAFNEESQAMEAGRIMLRRLHELGAQNVSFAFETTLASRTFAAFVKQLKGQGYAFRLFFFSLASADMAVARVQHRVRLGGHNVPEETIRRRYESGLRNFFELYSPLATSWRLYENSNPPTPHLIAMREENSQTVVLDEPLWNNRSRYGR